MWCIGNKEEKDKYRNISRRDKDILRSENDIYSE
jgi:hypothetical protein